MKVDMLLNKETTPKLLNTYGVTFLFMLCHLKHQLNIEMLYCHNTTARIHIQIYAEYNQL